MSPKTFNPFGGLNIVDKTLKLYLPSGKTIMDKNTKGTILFDGVCNLCNGLVQFIIKKDKNAKFVLGSLQSESGQQLLAVHDLPMNDFNSFVYLKDNQGYLKSSGALHVLKDLGGGWRLFYILIAIPRPVRDFFYTLIAKNRYRIFGKREACMLPTPEMKGRFLP